jgi:hypothetical protein
MSNVGDRSTISPSRREFGLGALAVSAPVTLTGVLSVAPSYGQTAAALKYSTTMPPGVASPDKVETRFGTLNFFDGFPDSASTEKLFDNLDFQRAVQAYLMAIPAVSQVVNRNAIRALGPVNTVVPIFEQLLDSRKRQGRGRLCLGHGGLCLRLPVGHHGCDAGRNDRRVDEKSRRAVTKNDRRARPRARPPSRSANPGTGQSLLQPTLP